MIFQVLQWIKYGNPPWKFVVIKSFYFQIVQIVKTRCVALQTLIFIFSSCSEGPNASSFTMCEPLCCALNKKTKLLEVKLFFLILSRHKMMPVTSDFLYMFHCCLIWKPVQCWNWIVQTEISQDPIITFHIYISAPQTSVARPCALSFHSNNSWILIKLEAAVIGALAPHWGVADKLKVQRARRDGNHFAMKVWVVLPGATDFIWKPLDGVKGRN